MRRTVFRQGFTLLEVLVATAMVSILSLSLYASLRTAFRARDSALNAVVPVRTAQVAVDLLKQDLESALPPTGVLAGPFIGQFGGEVAGTSALEFHCAGSAALVVHPNRPTRGPGIKRIELAVVQLPGSNTTALVRRVTHNLLAPTIDTPDEEVLCRGVRAFVLRYFDGLVWQETWDSTLVGDVLPIAIELNLELDRPDAGQSATPTYRISRVFTLPCHQDPTVEEGGL